MGNDAADLFYQLGLSEEVNGMKIDKKSYLGIFDPCNKRESAFI